MPGLWRGSVLRQTGLSRECTRDWSPPASDQLRQILDTLSAVRATVAGNMLHIADRFGPRAFPSGQPV